MKKLPKKTREDFAVFESRKTKESEEVKGAVPFTDKGKSIVELLAMPDVADIDFHLPRLNKELYKTTF